MVKVYFNNIRRQLLNEIESSRSSIAVAVYWFTNDHLFQKLLEKTKAGLKVELIIHNDYINNRSSGLPFQELIDAGGNFYFSTGVNPMHNKFCIIDQETVFSGSYNWTYYAEDKNRENVLLLKNESETVTDFIQEFERLKSLTEKVEKIRPLTKFEVDEFNQLRARDYLANDIVFQAKTTGKKEIIEEAFQIAPENIEVQKTAFALDLTKKWRLKHSIGSSLVNNGYLIIVPKDTFLPVSMTEIVQTIEDNQTSSTADILYGEYPLANQNIAFSKMRLTGLPKKPAGEAKMKYHFTIDIYGNLKMEKFSLDNGLRQTITKSVKALLEEVIN